MSGPIIPSVFYLYPLNTQIIEIDGVLDTVSGGFLNNATAMATLLDNFGRPDAVINDLPMSYIANSNGSYQGVVPDSFNAALGSGYTLVITVTAGSVQSQWSIPTQVKLRTQ